MQSYIRRNKDKINWENLSRNEGAIKLIEDNLDKISWRFIS